MAGNAAGGGNDPNRQGKNNNKNKGGNKGGGNKGGGKRKQGHPGGAGAVFGVRVLRYSGVQGVSLLTTNSAHFVSLIVIAHFLGPSELGTYSLLLFLSGLITQLFHLASKPGTIRRTFGMSDEDEDDDDDEGDEDISATPQRALGIGLVWSAILGVLATALVVVFRQPIGQFLLSGNDDATNLVVWAGILGGLGIVFKLASITLWLERRPKLFLISDTSRTILNLVGIGVFLALGKGVQGAIMGAVFGTAVATVLTMVLLRDSYELGFDRSEIAWIVKRGGYRATVVMSFWIVQQADVFILSRFLDHADIGIYKLGSQLGFVVSFLPQGFRMAMRPLRKGAVFQAVREQYGQKVARGQLLGYFTLLCITAVLLMVLGGELLVNVAPASYAAAAPLIPLTAAAMVTPALFRTVNGNTSYPSKRKRTFQVLVILGAVLYVVGCLLLVGPIGYYSPPVAMFVAFGFCSAYLFVRCQRSPDRIRYPYRQTLMALAVGALVVGVYELLPTVNKWIELPIIAAFMFLYFALLFRVRVIPREHWPAISHMVRSIVSGRPDRFNPRAGLRALDAGDRDHLHTAITARVSLEHLAGKTNGDRLSDDDDAVGAGLPSGDELVRILRDTGEHGGLPVGGRTDFDPLIAKFLFADAPTAVRNATMRRLLNEGAESNDLRALEDIVEHLAKVPPEAWEGGRASDTKHGLRRRIMRRLSPSA